MAEIVGLVTAGTSLLSLLNSCVTEFEYIQLARHIDRDFRTCQLSLNLAKLRLVRWGQSIEIHKEKSGFRDEPSTEQHIGAQATLKQIEILFRDLEKKSRRYSSPLQGRSRRSSPDNLIEQEVLDGPYHEIHTRTQHIIAQDLEWDIAARGGERAKVKWALHDSKAFDRLLSQLSQLITHLELLFPDQEPRRVEEAEKYVEGLSPASLRVLQQAADTNDDVGRAAARQEAMMGKNSIGIAVVSDEAFSLIGNEYSDNAIDLSGQQNVLRLKALSMSTENRVDRLEASGQSMTQIGSRFGGVSVIELALANRRRKA